MSPFLIVFALVFLAPIGYSVYLSLYRSQLIGGTRFVGLGNYRQAFGDHEFWSALGRVGLFLAVQVPVMLAIALLVASGDYVGLLPTHYAQLIGKRYALRARRASPTFVHPICAVTDPHRPSTHRAELFLSLLRELHTRSAAHLAS